MFMIFAIGKSTCARGKMSESIKKLYPISKEDVQKVRAIYNKTESDVAQDVEIIKNWLKQQPHFPKNHDDARLERFLLRNKFRLEQTKSKLETYFTLRGLHMDYLDIMSDLNYLQKVGKAFHWLPMPKLTPKMERVFVVKFTDDGTLYDLVNTMCYVMALLEIELSHDYAVGSVSIFDLSGITMTHYIKLDANAFMKIVRMHQEALCGRVAGLEFINAPSFFNLILAVFKMVFKPTLFNKITLHKSMETLYERVPKDCLPVDLGGELRSLEEVQVDADVMFEENIKFLCEQNKRVSDEEKRIGNVIQNDIYGIKGSFKKINID